MEATEDINLYSGINCLICFFTLKLRTGYALSVRLIKLYMDHSSDFDYDLDF